MDKITYSAMNQEFHDRKMNLSLPAGASWPARPVNGGKGDFYGNGFGVARAEEFWYCAWSREWLDQRQASPARAAAALRQLKLVREMSLYKVTYAPEVKDLTDQELEQAEKGNPDHIAANVEQNC